MTLKVLWYDTKGALVWYQSTPATLFNSFKQRTLRVKATSSDQKANERNAQGQRVKPKPLGYCSSKVLVCYFNHTVRKFYPTLPTLEYYLTVFQQVIMLHILHLPYIYPTLL